MLLRASSILLAGVEMVTIAASLMLYLICRVSTMQVDAHHVHETVPMVSIRLKSNSLP